MLKEQLEFLAGKDTEEERLKKIHQRKMALKRLEMDKKDVEEKINQECKNIADKPQKFRGSTSNDWIRIDKIGMRKIVSSFNLLLAT